MRFSTVAPLLLAATSAYATSLTSGYDIIQSRQAKIRRDVLDVCVGLNTDLILSDILQNGKPLIAGHLDVCLCVSLIPEFVKSNSACQTASGLLGVAKVTALLEALVNNHPDCQHCTFPDNSHSVCSPDWPCQFECHNGYSPYTKPGDQHPSSCSCPAPMTECNGQCGSYPNGCGSAVPVPPQRRSRHAQIGSAKRQVVNKPMCPADKQVCSVAGGNDTKSWECVDTKGDKESCGGCMTPAPFGVYHPATGKDCTSIPNVDAVDCQSATCYVTSCKSGFEPSADHDACVPAGTVAKRMFNLGPGIEAVAKPKREVFTAANADIRGLVKLGEGAGLASKGRH